MRVSPGPALFQGGRFPVEIDLGMKDVPMNIQPGITSSGVPEFTGGRFGSNLLLKDPSSQYNPQGRASPGAATWQEGVRFGNKASQSWSDKAPFYNPGG